MTSREPSPDLRRGKSAGDAGYLQRVGDRVRAARDRLGKTRKNLSEASGVSERYLADLEAGAGNASLLVLRRIAAALGLEMDFLLSALPDRSTELAALITELGTLSAAELMRVQDVLRRDLIEMRGAAGARRIALIGLRGAGKTTIGRATATALDVPFVELDREIERAAGMELSEIFALQGKAGFRLHELRCLEAVIGQFERSVIATGGGLVTEPATYELLLASCFVVWLKAAPESHMDRVAAQGDRRPMAGNPQAMDDLRAILADRHPLYERAHAIVDTTGKTAEAVVVAVLDAAARRK